VKPFGFSYRAAIDPDPRTWLRRRSHLESRWEIPGFAHYLRRLSSFSRLISFDKHGIGLSDPIPLDRLPRNAPVEGRSG
jgi:hypothetical protein